jgi:LysM repeat protein
LTVNDINAKKTLKIPKGGNQNSYIEEEQTTQWPKEKVQKDKQRSTKHTYKAKD